MGVEKLGMGRLARSPLVDLREPKLSCSSANSNLYSPLEQFAHSPPPKVFFFVAQNTPILSLSLGLLYVCDSLPGLETSCAVSDYCAFHRSAAVHSPEFVFHVGEFPAARLPTAHCSFPGDCVLATQISVGDVPPRFQHYGLAQCSFGPKMKRARLGPFPKPNPICHRQ